MSEGNTSQTILPKKRFRPSRIRGLSLTLLLTSTTVSGQVLHLGRAAVDITPPVDSVMGNSYGIKVAKGVHDPLYCKAMVLQIGTAKAGLVACDLISIRKPLVRKARSIIEETTSLTAESVIIAATHGHAGPQMHPMFLERVGGQPEALSREYFNRLPKLIAESVRQAEQDLQPAKGFFASGTEDKISFNRRFLLRDGTVKMNPGRRNPEAIRPLGPIDPEVGILYFTDLDGQPLITVANFALHAAIVGGDEFSAGYPGKLAKLLSDVLGDQMLTIFINGTSGNVNHVDVSQERQLSGHTEALRVATVLAADILKLHSRLKPLHPQPLQAASKTVPLPAPSVSPEQVQSARAVMSRYGTAEPPPFHDVVRAWRVLDLAELDGGILESEVQVVSLGTDVALVGFPGDAFVELGLAIKLNSSFELTLVSEQSGSGSISYVPNRKAFPEGGYEVISARFSPGGAERLVDSVFEIMTDLFPLGDRK